MNKWPPVKNGGLLPCKEMRRTLILISLLALFVLNLKAQTGTVKGVLVDKLTKEPLIGAMIKCETAAGGGYSDYMGNFSFSLPVGIHTLTISYLGINQTETGIVVKSGEITELNIEYGQGTRNAISGAINVVASSSSKTATAIQMQQKKAVNMLDGVSAQSFKRAGATTAGQAVSRVPGVSVQGGKHVYVRGLGDRYSKTILNSMIIPGLDPDKNTVQMDVFPSSLLDNILVYKTFSPDLPADFAGGLVDMNTKAFPSNKTHEISFNLNYNPRMHFKSDYISYQGGNMDFLGFDDGTRALPISKNIDLTAAKYDPSSNNPELTTLTSKFNKTLAPRQKMNTPDFRLSYTIGNSIQKKEKNYGYHFTLNYNKSTDYYANAEFGTYVKQANANQNELLLDVDAMGQVSSQNVRWSALTGGAYKYKGNSVQLSLLHSQNGESRTALLTQIDRRENPSTIIKNNLEYTQRSVTNLLIAGKHQPDSGKWELNWKISPTISIINEPDIRLTAFEYTDDENPRYEINEGVGAVATRTYRYLFEQNYNAKLDLSREFKLKNSEVSKLKFGFLETYKDRSFEILNYQFRVVQESKFTFSGNANELLADEVIWTPNSNPANDSGVYVSGNYEKANTYNAQQNIFSAYVMNELPISPRLKVIYGVRMEKALNFYTGSNQAGDLFENEKLLDETNFLPSANFIYKLKPDMNFRASYNHTLARPSFKELSNAQIVDRISGRTFIGNTNLIQTSITNYDLRWENFLKQGQMVSASAFYKQFENPIELVAYNATTPNDFQPQNVGTARVYGVEFELRKNINALTDTLRRVQFGTNLTFVYSSVEMTEGERAGRIQAAREGEVIGKSRDMVGQSPYVLNGFINYTYMKTGLDVSLSYNVQGPRLTIVGVSRNPDVYELPFHSLNLRASQPLGKKQKWTCSISAKNMLNSSRILVYRSYGAQERTFSKLMPQREFSLGFSYTFE